MVLHKGAIAQRSGPRQVFKGLCQKIGVLLQFPVRANEPDTATAPSISGK